MKLHINRRIKTYIAKTFSAFAVFVLTFVVCFSGFNVFQVHADSEVAISAVTKQTEVGPGDLLMVEVVANNFPGIAFSAANTPAGDTTALTATIH